MKLLIFLLLLSLESLAQEEELVRILEDQADQEDVKEVEEDLVQLQLFVTRPLNINTATAEQLHVFPFLTQIHVEQLIMYKKYAGDLVDVKELQAVSGWDISIIRKLMPYVVTRDVPGLRETFTESLKKGRHQLLTRFTLSGSSAFLFRYHFNSPVLEWGINMEKDAGERLVQGSKGISFLSGHALIRNRGAMKLLVFGDYIINLGQGLTLWQGRAVRKTAMPIVVKKQLPLLMPYRSNDENRYFRGAAVWFLKGKSEAALFVSSNGLDANTRNDSSSSLKYVTSFLNTGYHRDQNELEDKNAVGLVSTGGMVAVSQKRLRVAASSVVHMFSLPVIRELLPYNLYAAGGKVMANHAVSFHNTWRNVHYFGELAMDKEGDLAGMGGLMLAADPKLDIAMVARKIGSGYRAFFANAFTEASEPANEEGIYMGLSLKLGTGLALDAYADHYRFPWLRYRVDAPGWGRDYLAQFTLRPDKKTLAYLRFRSELKTVNTNNSIIRYIAPVSRRTVRIHLQHKVNSEWECRFRFESNLITGTGIETEHGFMVYADWFWDPLYKPFSLNLRAMVCETSSYTSRIYAYENDVLFYNIVPGFYGTLGRVYINGRLNMTKTASMFLKISKTFRSTEGNWQTRVQFNYTIR
jgi:hypothetical protein